MSAAKNQVLTSNILNLYDNEEIKLILQIYN